MHRLRQQNFSDPVLANLQANFIFLAVAAEQGAVAAVHLCDCFYDVFSALAHGFALEKASFAHEFAEFAAHCLEIILTTRDKIRE